MLECGTDNAKEKTTPTLFDDVHHPASDTKAFDDLFTQHMAKGGKGKKGKNNFHDVSLSHDVSIRKSGAAHQTTKSPFYISSLTRKPRRKLKLKSVIFPPNFHRNWSIRERMDSFFLSSSTEALLNGSDFLFC